MKKIILILFLSIFAFTSDSIALDGVDSLISPGDLATPHAKYEGITQCTKCHRVGGGIPDSTCLDCHDKLAKKIKEKKGPHAKYTDQCVKCHSDHKGRKYKMIIIEENKFDHNRTDYPLKDKHQEVKCNKCHKTEGIYTGLKQDCLSCHKDEHKAQLSNECSKCHNIKGWKDLGRFDHNIASTYALKGKHIDVKCAKCHVNKLYKPIKSKNCTDCHKDEHNKQFVGKTCEACHTVADWKKTSFDHNSPSYSYKLEGKHLKTPCDKCHKQGKYKPIEHKKCLDCHKDEHKNQFVGKTCESCHTVADWKKTSFDHNDPQYNGYKLEGKHLKTPCDKCHAQGKYKPIEHKKCLDCHKDEHKNQFVGKTCESCHTVTDWKKTAFDHNSPQYNGYKLEGKHLKTPCDKCHTQGKYKPIDHKKCLDCHKDEHNKQFAGKTCESCHTVTDWKKTSFDHNSPPYNGYKLEGKHLKTPCDKCHIKGKYKPIEHKKCLDCHKDEHKNQFAGKTCESCHTVADWKKTSFEHNSPSYSGYKLEGKHIKTPCDKCHTEGKYKPLTTVCQNCHQNDDVHKKELGEVCKNCHVAAGWKPSTLNHNQQTKFPLIGAHKSTDCSKCHKTKSYKTNNQKCVDCHNDVHKGKFKGECTSCHTQSDWNPRNFDHKQKTGYELTGVHNSLICQNCHTSKDNYKLASRYCNQCHTDMHQNQFGSIECSKCHTGNSWIATQFRHSSTRYPLQGAHRVAECSACHKNRVYRNTTQTCYNCHQSGYSSAPLHVQNNYGRDCLQCHDRNYASWTFRHQALNSNCSSCHLSLRPASHVSNPSNYPTTCELCHRYPTWNSINHTSMTTGCSSCHLSSRPASHVSNPSTYSTSCELCHRYPTWTFNHSSVSGSCSSCHLSSRPSSHVSNPSTYSTTCELCHNYPTWTFNHSSVSTSCSSCHSSTAPSAHNTYSSRFGSSCQSCHHYPSWLPASFVHSFSSFPTNHKGASTCSDCHASQNYGNKGGCIECHNSRGAEVHKTNSNSGCLNCHPTGHE
ncbi:MAG: hypothetical protein HYS21_11320 [Deltaproteobacteria bacterium]|nr:hypothetical protein [Deltaproteobacteria bacterium]